MTSALSELMACQGGTSRDHPEEIVLRVMRENKSLGDHIMKLLLVWRSGKASLKKYI